MKNNNNNNAKIGVIEPHNANSGKAETEEIEEAEWESNDRRRRSEMKLNNKSKRKYIEFESMLGINRFEIACGTEIEIEISVFFFKNKIIWKTILQHICILHGVWK